MFSPECASSRTRTGSEIALHEREKMFSQSPVYEAANCPQAVAVSIDKGPMTALTATET